MKRGPFRWKGFGAALAVSALLHWFYIVPRILAPLVEKPDAPLEVVMDVPQNGDDHAESTKEEPQKQKPILDEPAKVEAKKEKKPKPEEKAPEPAQVEPPKPKEAKLEPPKPKPPEPPKPPPPVPTRGMQAVTQKKFPDEADNPDAHFLAEKNHRAQEETRDKNTNLIREVETKTEQKSEENQNQDNKPGGKDEKIAELENRAGPDKTMPRSAPREGDEGTSTDKQKQGPLSMRDLTPKSMVTPTDGQKAREGVEMQESGAGELPMARIGRDAVKGHAAVKGGHLDLNHVLDHHMYDDIEGFDTAEKERNQAARAESSHHKGRYERYLAKAEAMRSSIENFTLAVKPGNQQELGTRAHPFAGYITSVHRQIHKLFAFGFLTDLEQHMGRGKTEYDDPNLFTRLEIVINADGTIDKVSIVNSSGVTGFDVAAIDSVMSAGPFEPPPKVIRSPNGKTYIHWGFHRNELACIAEIGSNVEPFILNTPPSGHEDDNDPTGDKAMWQRAKEARQGPRQLQREPEPGPSPSPSTENEPPASIAVPEVTKEARDAAEGWFSAYKRGSVSWLAGWSATPFTAAGEVVAKDATKLKEMYKQLIAEAPSRELGGLDQVLTPAGIRGKLGGLPPGGEEKDMLYAVGKVGHDEFILLLKKSNQGWRVCGIDR